MTRAELVRALAERRGLSVSAAAGVVDAVFGSIADGLAEGRRIELRGFGTFRARHYAAYRGRNPRTGEGVDVPRKVLPVFKPALALSRVVNPDPPGVSGS